MRSPWTQLYLHLVWSTWDRMPVLDEALRRRVFECIQAECTGLRVDVLAIGGVEDHVHLLVRTPATIAPADLAKQVKGASSHMVNHDVRVPFIFKWQGGYGAFSVSKRHVQMIRDYVLHQEEHHRDQRVYPVLEPPPPGSRDEADRDAPGAEKGVREGGLRAVVAANSFAGSVSPATPSLRDQ